MLAAGREGAGGAAWRSSPRESRGEEEGKYAVAPLLLDDKRNGEFGCLLETCS
jgi:hypothetical protein